MGMTDELGMTFEDYYWVSLQTQTSRPKENITMSPEIDPHTHSHLIYDNCGPSPVQQRKNSLSTDSAWSITYRTKMILKHYVTR